MGKMGHFFGGFKFGVSTINMFCYTFLFPLGHQMPFFGTKWVMLVLKICQKMALCKFSVQFGPFSKSVTGVAKMSH